MLTAQVFWYGHFDPIGGKTPPSRARRSRRRIRLWGEAPKGPARVPWGEQLPARKYLRGGHLLCTCAIPFHAWPALSANRDLHGGGLGRPAAACILPGHLRGCVLSPPWGCPVRGCRHVEALVAEGGGGSRSASHSGSKCPGPASTHHVPCPINPTGAPKREQGGCLEPWAARAGPGSKHRSIASQAPTTSLCSSSPP